MQQQAVNLQVQNAQIRQMLRESSPLMRKKLPTDTSGGLGKTSRIKLFNVGLLTNIFLRIDVNVTIGTANTTVGPKGLPAIINRIRLVDFDGQDRINCSGFQLFQRNSVRDRKMCLEGFNANFGTAATNTTNYNVAGLTNPNVPVAVGTQDLTMFLQVPVAADVDSGDLRGAILAQTNVGELYLSIDWAAAAYGNADDDKVFNGAATSTVAVNSISVEPLQEYYLPQSVGGIVPIPPLDIMTVYEIGGYMRSSDNLIAGSDKLLNLPNVRSIVGAYASYLNNNVLGGSAGNDINNFKLIANGNNIIEEYTQQFQYYMQRRRLGSDLTKGVYFWDYSANPINTFLYGNVQLAFNPTGTVTAGANLEVCYESFYQKGAALSGIVQAG